MALSAKLVMRQSQAMVLTPQLLQAIKLLQMPNLELTQFIENELASNPLLERAEEREEPSLEQAEREGEGFAEAPPEPGDWAREALGTDTGHLAANLGTEVENTFDADRTAPAVSVRAGRRLERERPGRASAPATKLATPRTSKLMSQKPCRFATTSSVRPRSCFPIRPNASSAPR